MNDKKAAWDALLNAGKLFLLTVIAYFVATKQPDQLPVVVPVVAPVVSPTPAPATPKTPVVAPVVSPQQPVVAPIEPAIPPKITTVIVEDSDHNRIRPSIANTIVNLADFQTGTYYYIGYPEEGTPVRRTITISDGTGPRPPPTVPDTPEDPPIVAPAVPEGVRIIFAYETSDKLTKEQQDILLDGDIRDALKAKCSKSKDEKGRESFDFRFWDRQPELTSEFPLFKDLWTAAEPMLSPHDASKPVIEMIVFRGGKGEISVVKNKADVLAALNK